MTCRQSNRDNDRVSVSQDELQRVVKLWQSEADKEASNPYQSLFPYVHPLVVGAVDRASALSTKLCIENSFLPSEGPKEGPQNKRHFELRISFPQLPDYVA
jgi:hypothetical protein